MFKLYFALYPIHLRRKLPKNLTIELKIISNKKINKVSIKKHIREINYT